MNPLRALLVMAHPDDAESSCGGLILRLQEAGARVKVLVMTNGDAGCAGLSGEAAAELRAREARAAAAFMGFELEILPIHDGYLEPSLANRETVARRIRAWNADLIVGHPPFDYHPDHRAAAQLVADAGFLASVRAFCPDTPVALTATPILLYHQDINVTRRDFKGDWALDLEPYLRRKAKALSLHRDQMLRREEYGLSDDEIYPRILARTIDKNRRHADMNRELLIRQYGEARGAAIRYAEVYRISEFGRQVDPAGLGRLVGID